MTSRHRNSFNLFFSSCKYFITIEIKDIVLLNYFSCLQGQSNEKKKSMPIRTHCLKYAE